MALTIAKSVGTFKHAEVSNLEFNSLYGRVSFSAGPSGSKIDVSVSLYDSEASYNADAYPVNIKEKADIELQKSFQVEGYTEQTTAIAHAKMKDYLESEEGGNYTVNIVGLD
jgi:hypothetical protein